MKARIGWPRGDFSTRVAVSSRDELGHLAQDFNQLASSLEKMNKCAVILWPMSPMNSARHWQYYAENWKPYKMAYANPPPESLSSLQAEVAILTKLVNDLHQLSQSDRGALAYRKTQLDVVRLLQVAIASFHGRFQNKKMTITAHLPEHAVIFGDPDRLNQLFHNLLENSLRYTNEGGALEIIALIQEETLTLHWQDSKPGG